MCPTTATSGRSHAERTDERERPRGGGGDQLVSFAAKRKSSSSVGAAAASPLFRKLVQLLLLMQRAVHGERERQIGCVRFSNNSLSAGLMSVGGGQEGRARAPSLCLGELQLAESGRRGGTIEVHSDRCCSPTSSIFVLFCKFANRHLRKFAVGGNKRRYITRSAERARIQAGVTATIIVSHHGTRAKPQERLSRSS